MVTVAGGRFAPGHLGELTRQVPFEMIDEVLAATGAVQRRVRDLPSRVVVYLLLAGCLFTDIGYLQVWDRLVTGLGGLPVATPTAAGLAQARRRVGVKPLRALFDLVRGPGASTAVVGVRWRGLLPVAVDGTTLSVADSPANLTVFTKQPGPHGPSGYPMMRVLVLVACGTRTIIDAVFGPTAVGETRYVPALMASLRPSMLLLADRVFGAGSLIRDVRAAGAHILLRVRIGATGAKLPVLTCLPDGSYLSLWGGQQVRVIDAEITIATPAGAVTEVYRLVTTLLTWGRYPAADLAALYHERWEIETAYREVKSGILAGRVLRARTPIGVAQEVYALLVTYQILRLAMTDATNTRSTVDPDRASFTIALHAARDQVIQANGVTDDTVIDLVGVIGRHVLAHLLPERRLRTSPRAIKRAASKYQARGTVTRTSHPADININIRSARQP